MTGAQTNDNEDDKHAGIKKEKMRKVASTW